MRRKFIAILSLMFGGALMGNAATPMPKNEITARINRLRDSSRNKAAEKKQQGENSNPARVNNKKVDTPWTNWPNWSNWNNMPDTSKWTNWNNWSNYIDTPKKK